MYSEVRLCDEITIYWNHYMFNIFVSNILFISELEMKVFTPPPPGIESKIIIIIVVIIADEKNKNMIIIIILFFVTESVVTPAAVLTC